MTTSCALRLGAMLLCLPWTADIALAGPTFQREGVLGTSFEMQIEADPDTAQAALDAVLGEIAELDAQLSRWREDSVLSAFNRSSRPMSLPAPVAEVLEACEQWRQRTGSAFSCRIGALAERWREAQTQGVMPVRSELRRLARAIDALALAPASGGRQSRPDLLRIDADGLAKGYVLDRALRVAREAAPGAVGIRIDIGGDAVYWGHPTDGAHWTVGIADPRAPADNAELPMRLMLQSQAIASSGHHSRPLQIGRRRFSHILDPRTGWPLVYAPSAIVVAPDALQADALATALTVMNLRDGLDLVNRLPGVEALVASDAGVHFASTGWHTLLQEPASEPRALHQGKRMRIEYRIPDLGGERYRKPYLAIWITDGEGAPVRQLLVLGDRARWLSELPQWWRHYGRNDDRGLHGIARPTRAPGHYSLDWDGRDDSGRSLPVGEYFVHVEAAREHGDHELMRLPLHLASHPLRLQARGAREIGDIRIELHTD